MGNRVQMAVNKMETALQEMTWGSSSALVQSKCMVLLSQGFVCGCRVLYQSLVQVLVTMCAEGDF